MLILTTFDLDEYAFSGLRAGASGFLLKDVPPPQLTAAIRAVAAGDAVVAPRVTRRLLDAFAHRLPDAGAEPPPGPVDDPRLRELTAREREVLLELAHGRTNAEIAERLVPLRGDGQDPRRADPGQARPARPRAGGDPRLPARAGAGHPSSVWLWPWSFMNPQRKVSGAETGLEPAKPPLSWLS